MANRTFKVYGQAYAASGDVSVTMTVGGTQVFTGAVNDSTTVRDGQPTIQNHLWTYTMDENTVGNLVVTIAVTGGELCLGQTEDNLHYTQIIPSSWVEANPDLSAANQTYLATNIGQTLLDAESAGLYDKLVAGTATLEADAANIGAANSKGARDATVYEMLNDLRDNLQIDGVALSEASTTNDKAGWWPIVQDGETLSYDWTYDPDAVAL
jgi:hypothetical protein